MPRHAETESADIFDPKILSLGHLQVAKENHHASQPPFRSLDIGGEIKALLEKQMIREKALAEFSDSETTNQAQIIPFSKR